MKIDSSTELLPPGPTLARSVSVPVAVALVACVLVLAVYHGTVERMVALWSNSGTYGHCYLVVPAAVWLAWQRRSEIAWERGKAWYPALVLVAGAGFAWLLGELVSVSSVQQFALVGMVQAVLLAILGPRLFRELLFPIAFLLFAVPTGEFLTPTLIDWTADFTVAALQLTGIPVYRQGNDFFIPTGQWSVVDACSGIRYLSASIMGGTAFAYLHYRRAWKRLAFIGVSILVPIVANWLRAYLIVLVGHLSGNTIAAGADHIMYGTVFFAVIIFTLFGIGLRFRSEDDKQFAAPASSLDRNPAPASLPARSFVLPALVVLAAATLWLPLAAALQARLDAGEIALRGLAVSGWNETPAATARWTPVFHGPRSALHQAFEARGVRVHVAMGYFADQGPDRELVTHAHQFLIGNDKLRPMARGSLTVNTGSGPIAVPTVVLQQDTGRIALGALYWVGGRFVTSAYAVKALTALDTLTRGSDDAAVVLFYAELDENGKSADLLRPFIEAALPDARAALVEARKR